MDLLEYSCFIFSCCSFPFTFSYLTQEVIFLSLVFSHACCKIIVCSQISQYRGLAYDSPDTVSIQAQISAMVSWTTAVFNAIQKAGGVKLLHYSVKPCGSWLIVVEASLILPRSGEMWVFLDLCGLKHRC